MKKINQPLSKSLREQAEEILQLRLPITALPQTEAETLKLIHELQIRQIELELQNKELLQAQELKSAYDNDQKYRYMFASNPQPMWIYDLETLAFLEVNDAAIHHYGYSKEEFLSMTLKNIRPKEDIEALMQDIEKTKNVYNPAGQWRHLKKNGEIIFVEIISHPITFNGQKARHVMVTDITERKQSEASILAKHELFRTTFNISPLSSVLTKLPERTIIEVNPAFEKLFGYTNSEVIDQAISELDFWADLKEQERVAQLLLKNGKVYDFEFVFKTKSGKTGNGIFYSEVIEQLDEKFVLTKVLDITDRKQAEAALRESEKLFSRAFRSSPVAITITNRNNGKFIEVNNAWSNINGFTAKEAIGLTPAELNIIDAETRQKIIDEIKTKNTLNNIELSLKSKTGNYHTVLFSSENIEIAGEPCVLSTGIDITDRKLAEEKLNESEERFRLAFDTSPDSIAISRVSDGVLVSVNKGFIKTSGYTEEEIIGKSSSEINSWKNPGDRDKFINEFRTKGEVRDFEAQLLTRRGEIYGQLSASIFELKGVPHVLGIMRDITERKQAEEAMKQNNSRLELAMQSANMAWWEMDITTGNVIFDHRKSEMLSFPAEKFKHYKDFMALVHPEDNGKAMNAMRMHIDGLADKYEVEYRILTQSGEYKWFYDIGIVKKDNNGKPLIATGLVIDITKRKLAEEVLRDREYLLSSSQRAAHVGTWSWKVGDATTYWSDETYKIYGLSPEMGPPDFEFFFEIIHPEDRHKMREWSEKVLAGLHPAPVEFRVLRPDGIYRVIRTEGDIVDTIDGVPSRIAGTAYDITERIQAEEEIRQLNERIATATRSARVGIWDWDVVNNLLVWDDQMYELYGLKKDEFSGAYEAWVSGLHHEDRQFSEEETNLALQGVKVYDSEFRVVWPDGSIRYLKAKGEVFRDDEGKPIRMLGVNFDITDRKLAEENIRQLNEELEQRVLDRTAQLEAANKELEVFSYSVSHDLRAPLRHINGFVDLLNEKYTDLLPEKGKHYLSVIHDASGQMGNLIDDLLQFSRTGRQEMQQTDLDMNFIIQEVVQFNEGETKNRNIDWDIAKLPTIKGDLSLMRMVWFNLISNAIKFTREKDYAQIKIGFTDEKNEFIFYIRDNGAGFDMRYVHKLFGVFQRLHSKQQFEGTGIGLANIQRIIKRHDGRIWAESELNQGATFYFTIPKTEKNKK
jgi:PAS domain S-box-containing protein